MLNGNLLHFALLNQTVLYVSKLSDLLVDADQLIFKHLSFIFSAV